MECQKNHKSFDMPNGILDAAKKEDLVLFCGAGISTENKTVMPNSFYSNIKEELGVTSNDLSFSELMECFCQQPNGRRRLIKKLKKDLSIYIHFLN